VFSGRAEAETGTGARLPTFELVPGLLLENLDTVAARIGIGLLVDCARVSWSLNAFRTISALTSGLVLSSANRRNPFLDIDVTKIRCELGEEVEDSFEKGVYVPMKGWHTSLGGSIPSVKNQDY
jgi:hypothetical protein